MRASGEFEGSREFVGGRRSGARSSFTRARNAEASNVNGAPRRAWASTGSGKAESWARVRWKPSMGTMVAMEDVGVREREAWRLFKAVVMRVARVVLPVLGRISGEW